MGPDSNPVLFLDFQGQVQLVDSQEKWLMLHLAHSAPENELHEKRKGNFDSPYSLFSHRSAVTGCLGWLWLPSVWGSPWTSLGVPMGVEGNFLRGLERGNRSQTWGTPGSLTHWKIQDQVYRNQQKASPIKNESPVPLRGIEPKPCLFFSQPGHPIFRCLTIIMTVLFISGCYSRHRNWMA